MSEEKEHLVVPTPVDERTLLPVLPLKNVVALPKSIIPVIVGRDISIKAVDYALSNRKELFVTAQKSADTQSPSAEDLFTTGTMATILQASRLPNGTLKILIEGVTRSRVVEFVQREEGFLGAYVELLHTESLPKNASSEALWRTLFGLFKEYINLNDKVPKDLAAMFKELEDLDYLADTVAAHIQLKLAERQKILETVDLRERVVDLIELLQKEIEIIKTEQKIRKRVQTQVEKHQKDYYLSEQMRAIQRELGRDDQQRDIDALRTKAKKAHMSAEAMEKVEAELTRLEQMQPTSPEAAVGRNYVEWLISLPWHKESKDRVSLEEAQRILNSSHAGLKKAKERVLEFIASKKFAKNHLKRSPILVLSGPPGVGKTSLAKTIAKALGREFVRISLGGMRDEAEIRGHRRTYIGAMPGKIVQAMKKAKTVNPVMLLDEIDKMAMDFRGDPAAALLEALDPEHNNTFSDHFLEVDYDLSKVMFIATANVIDNVPYPLLDRMEGIPLAGYTRAEKLDIARSFLLPKLFDEHALKVGQVKISDDIILCIIDDYTKEAGVRQIERLLAKMIRKSIEELLRKEKRKKESVVINQERLFSWLGAPKYKKPDRPIEEHVGVATGLAWTEAGGDVLEVEITIMKGKGSLSLTGQLGEVMQESAQAALSYVRSRAREFGLKEGFYSDIDIHIHVPEGAIPKDGPSAGITMTTALVSALTKIPIKKEIVMTGEVTLRGRVLPVGGLKEKLLAAIRFGAKVAIVPQENEEEIKEFSSDLDPSLHLIYARTMDQVLVEALIHMPSGKKQIAAARKTTVALRHASKSITR